MLLGVVMYSVVLYAIGCSRHILCVVGDRVLATLCTSRRPTHLLLTLRGDATGDVLLHLILLVQCKDYVCCLYAGELYSSGIIYDGYLYGDAIRGDR